MHSALEAIRSGTYSALSRNEFGSMHETRQGLAESFGSYMKREIIQPFVAMKLTTQQVCYL